MEGRGVRLRRGLRAGKRGVEMYEEILLKYKHKEICDRTNNLIELISFIEVSLTVYDRCRGRIKRALLKQLRYLHLFL